MTGKVFGRCINCGEMTSIKNSCCNVGVDFEGAVILDGEDLMEPDVLEEE